MKSGRDHPLPGETTRAAGDLRREHLRRRSAVRQSGQSDMEEEDKDDDWAENAVKVYSSDFNRFCGNEPAVLYCFELLAKNDLGIGVVRHAE